MAMLEIKKAGDPVLKEVCKPIEHIDKKLRTLLDDMAETMYKNDGVGIAAYDLREGTVWATDLGTYGNTSYSFFVELINASGKVYTQKAATSYDNLLSSGYVSASALDRPTGALTGGFNGAAVPEPTSGVLLLVGGALLALRRRRA